MPGTIGPLVIARALSLGLALVCAAGGCLPENYDDPDGPRYAGDYTEGPVPVGAELLVVSYNLEYSYEIETGIEALSTAPLAGADLVLMQEMNLEGIDTLASRLAMAYVYYPSSVSNNGDFGTAIMSRHPITADYKLQLPHADPFTGRKRAVSVADLDVGGVAIRAYSVHTSIPTLGLGGRLDQLEAMIDDAEGFGGAVIIGGDFNTVEPDAGDQSVTLFEERGYAYASEIVDATNETLGLEFLLDYIFVRDLAPLAGGVYEGESGSDHAPIWAEVVLP
jgi:endonuclease/exonuclease/phosphatase (EEP) superfamily protein YafD